jgi:hypothetical protein
MLAACSAADCPPPESPERTELRLWLRSLVHVSQCGGPTPSAFQAAAAEQSGREEAFLDRVRRSPLAEDLARAIREDREASAHVFEADCNMTYWNQPDAPGNVAAFRAQLDYERQNLQTAQAAFARAIAGCPPA